MTSRFNGLVPKRCFNQSPLDDEKKDLAEKIYMRLKISTLEKKHNFDESNILDLK